MSDAYTATGSGNGPASLGRTFSPQLNAAICKQLKKIRRQNEELLRQNEESLRQDKEITTLLRFMCFAILRTYEREDTLGRDYAAMMFNLKPHSRKKKRRMPLTPSWLSYEGR